MYSKSIGTDFISQFHWDWFHRSIPLVISIGTGFIGQFHWDWFHQSIPSGLVLRVNSIGTGSIGQFHLDWFHRSTAFVGPITLPRKVVPLDGATGLFDCFGQSVCSINRPLSHQFHCIFSQVRFWLSFGHEFLHQQGDGGIEKEKSLLQIPKAERKTKHTVSITSY